MLKVIAEDFIKTEYIDIVLPLYKELVTETKKEKDYISYNLYIDNADKGHFIFIEEWPNQDALDKHCRTEHFTRLVPIINSYSKKPGTFIFMHKHPYLSREL